MSFINTSVLLIARKNLNSSAFIASRILFANYGKKLSACVGFKFKKAFLHNSASKASIYRNNVKETHVEDLPEYGQPLESWYYDVHKFGKVMIRSPMSIHLQPLNPQKHPAMNKLFLNILYIGNDKLDCSELTNLAKQYIVSVNLDDKNEEIDVNIKYKSDSILPTICHLQVPMKYDVDVSCKKNGEVSLEKLESSNINVKTQKGNCYLKSVKSGNIEVRTSGGHVVSQNHLQGNMKLRCSGEGEINAGRLQGQTVDCWSEQGNISVKSIYADTCDFSTQSGNIHLGSCHGNSDVRIQDGNLTVDTLDGNLKGHVGIGESSVYVAREGELTLTCNDGNILVKVPTSLQSSLCLSGSQIDEGDVTINSRQEAQDENGVGVTVTGQLGTSSPSSGNIEASTKDGSIKLQYHDWFSTLNLKEST